ncbi:hypothetical protein FRC05_011466 [Tulasnella sp. 425]|nr:hypothetical protein FRC05_011466 [Tulasnella sp. 425]
MDRNPHGPPPPDSTPGASDGNGSHASHGAKKPASYFYFCPTCGRAPSADSPASISSDHPLHAGGSLVISTTDEFQLLKAQVQNVAPVCEAVANGDLTPKITVSVQGSVMVQLKEVHDGRMLSRIRKTVNKLAANLTDQVRAIAQVTEAVALGDLSKMIEVDGQGDILELKMTVSGMEMSRVSLEVGTLGNLGGQADVPDVEGVWWQLKYNMKKMYLNSTKQVQSIATVTTAVAKGDLTQRMEIDVEGEMATLKDTVNLMVQQLNTFASNVARIALEAGTMGVLGGQAQVEGV